MKERVDVRGRPEKSLFVGETVPDIAVAFPELLVQTVLRLLPKSVMDSRQDDEHPVAGIRGLGDYSGEVGGLSTLDVTENESITVVFALACWIQGFATTLVDDLSRSVIMSSFQPSSVRISTRAAQFLSAARGPGYQDSMLPATTDVGI